MSIQKKSLLSGPECHQEGHRGEFDNHWPQATPSVSASVSARIANRVKAPIVVSRVKAPVVSRVKAPVMSAA